MPTIEKVDVAPARERGLKLKKDYLTAIELSRSREGAWIEISLIIKKGKSLSVAPARERGLKSCGQCLGCRLDSRSREGAWIEICNMCAVCIDINGRSREGAWIEMPSSPPQR